MCILNQCIRRSSLPHLGDDPPFLAEARSRKADRARRLMVLQWTFLYVRRVVKVVKASSAPIHLIASSRRYRKCAAECAKLARAAPSPMARDSFYSAAKSWLILATLEKGSTWPNNIRFAVEPQGGSIGESETNDLTPAPK